MKRLFRHVEIETRNGLRDAELLIRVGIEQNRTNIEALDAFLVQRQRYLSRLSVIGVFVSSHTEVDGFAPSVGYLRSAATYIDSQLTLFCEDYTDFIVKTRYEFGVIG